MMTTKGFINNHQKGFIGIQILMLDLSKYMGEKNLEIA
jgi:hypothetical protein